MKLSCCVNRLCNPSNTQTTCLKSFLCMRKWYPCVYREQPYIYLFSVAICVKWALFSSWLLTPPPLIYSIFFLFLSLQVFPSTLDQEKMHGESPYNVMFGKHSYSPFFLSFLEIDLHNFSVLNFLLLFFFNLSACPGPDICGPGTKKVHVIFSYKGKNHLIKKEIRCKVGQ